MRRGETLGRKQPVQKSHALILSPIEWLMVGGIVSLITVVMLVLLETDGRAPSTRSNLRMIAGAAHVYAEKQGEWHLPDSFEALVSSDPTLLAPRHFISPKGDETAAENFEQMFSEPGHISFVWAGRGLRVGNVRADTILVYQDRSTRDDGRVWVAFADGSTRAITVSELQERLRATAALLDDNLSGEAGGCLLTESSAPAASPE